MEEQTIPVSEPDAPISEEEPQNREDAIAAEISSLFTSDENGLEPEPLSVDIPYEAPVPVANTYDEEDDGFSLEGILYDEPIAEEDYPEDEFIEDVPELKH
jgi:hypothetical protein